LAAPGVDSEERCRVKDCCRIGGAEEQRSREDCIVIALWRLLPKNLIDHLGFGVNN
jgi:hypothetical protein